MRLLADGGQLRDLGVYLARLQRLDREAFVRMRRVDDSRLALWCWTPLEVLALRGMVGALDGEPDVTVRVADLLNAVRGALTESTVDSGTVSVLLPASQDLMWRGSLPPSGGEVLDTVPASQVEGVLEAAERTFREVSATVAVPQRPGEALLDHVALTVTGADAAGVERLAEVSIKQLVVAARLGFLGKSEIQVGVAGAAESGWTFIAGRFGVLYRRPTGMFYG